MMTEHRKRIYLAGKITGTTWRSYIARGIQEVEPDERWPVLERAIFNRFDYVGPYLDNVSHQHDVGRHGQQNSRVGDIIVGKCLRAIGIADLIFAWLDSRDCYGTLVEIGYAAGLDSKPAIVIGMPSFTRENAPCAGCPYEGDAPCDICCGPFNDLWFASAMANGLVFHSATPAVALQTALWRMGWLHNWSSPLEAAFWEEWHRQTDEKLETQYQILGGRYRLDFAHLASKTAIEMDGYTYHKRQFQHDRQRDRELLASGWRTIRFAGDELRTDIKGCVRQALELVNG